MVSSVLHLRDLAFWRSDEEKFADLVRRGVIAAGENRPVLFDESAFALHSERPKEDSTEVGYLQNLFAAYTRLPKAKLAQELEHIIASFTESREAMPRDSRPFRIVVAASSADDRVRNMAASRTARREPA